MTFEELFDETKRFVENGDLTGFDGNFKIQMNIKGGGAFCIACKGGKAEVSLGEQSDADTVLATSAEDYLRLAEGTLNPVLAAMFGKLSYSGSIEKALEFQKMLAMLGNYKRSGGG